MGDKEEINEIPENHEDRNERQILPQIRVRNIQQNILGEQHQLPMLPQGVFPIFPRHGVMNPRRNINQFLIIL
jgi:hypothetical protein